MLTTRNTLPEATRERMIALLNARLADSIDLMLQTKQAHWNVKGPAFYTLHTLFDAVYDAVEEHVDLMAERAVQLGGVARGALHMVSSATTLTRYPDEAAGSRAHIEALTQALVSCGTQVREAIEIANTAGDADTADLFTGVSRDLDKQLWLVESHLAPG
ncbi:MAG: DNA starvation/stationary phase protection protein Dps [Gemmatimonadaceae bacterium]|nr:DNA starvation/stationary phase protection protein Dps [Gemmatimonadaceae bacterium]